MSEITCVVSSDAIITPFIDYLRVLLSIKNTPSIIRVVNSSQPVFCAKSGVFVEPVTLPYVVVSQLEEALFLRELLYHSFRIPLCPQSAALPTVTLLLGQRSRTVRDLQLLVASLKNDTSIHFTVSNSRTASLKTLVESVAASDTVVSFENDLSPLLMLEPGSTMIHFTEETLSVANVQAVAKQNAITYITCTLKETARVYVNSIVQAAQKTMTAKYYSIVS